MAAPAARPATRGDRAVVAGALARAFADDPLMAWLHGGEARRRHRLPRFFARLYDECGAGTMRWTTEGGEAATLWHGPDEARRTPWQRLGELGPWLRIMGARLPRAMALGERIERTRLAGPHWYLVIAGCDPYAKGSGKGGAVIRAGLARADADGLPCCLETAKEANLSLYRRFGFEVTAEWRVADGPPVWSMARPGASGVRSRRRAIPAHSAFSPNRLSSDHDT